MTLDTSVNEPVAVSGSARDRIRAFKIVQKLFKSFRKRLLLLSTLATAFCRSPISMGQQIVDGRRLKCF